MRRADRDHAPASLRHDRRDGRRGRAVPALRANREAMLRVIRNHRRAAYDAPAREYEGLTITPVGIDPAHCPSRTCWPRRATRPTACSSSASSTATATPRSRVIAPTGTIGLVMDCDTTGIEPDFALVKFKKLAGGGYFKIINAVRAAGARAARLHAAADRRHRPLLRRRRHARRLPAHQPGEPARARASTTSALDRVEAALPRRFDVALRVQPLDARRRVLSRARSASPTSSSTSPASTCSRPSASPTSRSSEANDYVCGTMTIEGAPHLRDEHLPVFDCANRCGKRQAVHPRRGAHPHDGRRPAVHLGRDLQDDQHAARGHGRGRRRVLPLSGS